MASDLTETELIKLIRKGIRQPSTTNILDADISLSIETAIDILGDYLIGANPQYFRKRVTVQAEYAPNVFSVPSDLYRLDWVKDLGTTAGTVTGATNASPIVITESSHGRADDDVVTIHGVVGNTAANGTWQITYVDANSYSLDGSTGNNDYSSGGKVFKEEDFTLLYRRKEYDSDNSSVAHWVPRENKIVVDSPLFDNDILIGYVYRPDAIDEIPAEFHRIGLESYGVIDNIELPASDSPRFYDMKASYQRHADRWQLALKRAQAWRMTNESETSGQRSKRYFF